jgi:hypothetical protein
MDKKSRLFRLSRLLAAWHIISLQRRRKKRRCMRADQHWRRVLTSQVLEALEIAAQDAPVWKQSLCTARVRKVHLRQAFKVSNCLATTLQPPYILQT